MSKAQRAYIAFGSNLGDRLGTLQAALSELQSRAKIKVTKLSSVYETEPVGYLDQGPFLNGVLELETSLEAMDLLAVLLGIEAMFGRVRDKKDGPRTLDLDMIFYGDLLLEREDLILPHPRLHERAFVLLPLRELAPELVHPVLAKTVEELCQETLKGAVLQRFPGALSIH